MIPASMPLPWNSGVTPKIRPKIRSALCATLSAHIRRNLFHQPNLPLKEPITRFKSGTMMKKPMGSSL